MHVREEVRSISALWSMGWGLIAVERCHEWDEPGTYVSLLSMEVIFCTNHMGRRGSLLQCILYGTRLLTTQKNVHLCRPKSERLCTADKSIPSVEAHRIPRYSSTLK